MILHKLVLSFLCILLHRKDACGEATSTFQYRAGCVLEKGRNTYFWRSSYNNKDIEHYDYERQCLVADYPSAKDRAEEYNKSPSFPMYWNNLITDLCSSAKKLFDELPAELGRLERSSVSVSLETKEKDKYLECLVHGFHPSYINVTWLRDGKEQFYGVTSSGILPLKDGTFHIRKYLPIGDSVGGSYACQVEHESLVEAILVHWDPVRKTSFLEKILGIPVLIIGVCFPIFGYIYKRKFPKRGRKETSSISTSSLEGNPQAAPLNPEENTD